MKKEGVITKRILNVFWMLLLLTACTAEPQEIPRDLPQELPEPIIMEQSVPEPKPTELDFSEVNPNPVSYIFMEAGQRFTMVEEKPVEMPAAPFVEHDAFYFPLQFVAEAMGVQFAFADGCAYLKCDGHLTQFFIDSSRFIVDSVEEWGEGERRLYREGLPQGAVDEYFTPLLRDGVVFLPVEYLPVEFHMSYNSFGPQICIDDYGNQVHFQNDRWLPRRL